MSPLGGFDQVVAISQWKINNDLKARYEKSPTPLQHFKASSGAAGDWAVDATFSLPTVELCVSGKPRKVIFRLNFTDGHFGYPQGDDDKTQRLSVQGWSLAFLANLTSSKLSTVPSELRSGIPEDILSQIENTGSYSLTQAVVDPRIASVINIDFSRSSTPGLVASDACDEIKKQVLVTIMKVYFHELAEGRHNVLGYAITASKTSVGNDKTPSPSPAPVYVQVMPCADGPDVSPETHDRDALLFLERVGDTTGRSPPPVPLPGSHAWVPEGKVGNMIIHRNAFWKGFLVNHLTFFISDAVRLANTIAHWIQSEDWKGALSQEAPWIISNPEKRPITDGWGTVTGHSANFNWHGRKQVETSSQGCWEGSFEETKDLYTDVSVIAEIVPNTPYITLKTRITYHYKDDRDNFPLGRDSSDYTHSTKAEIEWVTKLILNSAANVTVDMVEVGGLKSDCTSEVIKYGVLHKIVGGDKKANPVVEQRVKKYLRENVKREQIEALTNDGLKTRSRFVFSGPGACIMKNPKFTQDRDLQVYLESKGE